MLNIGEIREVTVFSIGDSAKISTWSNVPYFFTEVLIKRGVKINRVDLSPSRVLEKIYNLTFLKIIRLFYKNTSYTYFRSYIQFFEARLRIRKASKKYKNSDLNIFLTFSFSSAGISNKPVVLFSDWTFDHYLNYFEERKPDRFEKSSISRENEQIEKADLVFSLFPSVTDYMRQHYRNKKIFYLGNVINSLYEVSKTDILKKKKESKSLIFIGAPKYIEGARQLITAFLELRKEYPMFELNIVGMSESILGYLPEGVNCYGYLDKGKDDQRQLFYSLLQNAKIFINTSPKWGAFSATIESMYFYNPIIITPYKEFIETFGTDINFGVYCKENRTDLLCTSIRKILDNPSYNEMCLNSHAVVEGFTWDAYIDKMLKIINEKL